MDPNIRQQNIDALREQQAVIIQAERTQMLEAYGRAVRSFKLMNFGDARSYIDEMQERCRTISRAADSIVRAEAIIDDDCY